jgi:hypothetical protein
LEQQALQEACEREAASDPESNARDSQAEPLPKNQPQNIGVPRAERTADSDLASSLRDASRSLLSGRLGGGMRGDAEMQNTPARAPTPETRTGPETGRSAS